MLTNFFRLDAPSKTIGEIEINDHFAIGSDLRDALYEPDEWPARLSKMKGRSFHNVSLSKTSFKNVTFTNCKFSDCLFIGANFKDVEFHNCTFTNCNLYKSNFSSCYIDPNSFFFNKTYRNTHANIPVSLYQNILENSAAEKQDNFARIADIKFRRWKRDQLRFDYKSGKITIKSLIIRHSGNWLYEAIAGYGYSPVRYAGATMIFFSAASLLTMRVMDGKLIVGGQIASNISLYDSLFYTYSMMTALGFSSVIPATPDAKLYAIFLALSGIAWLGVFTSLLVKRVLK